MTRISIGLVALVLAASPAHGQHVSPYADLTGRDIKALSPEQIAQLRAGEGMGLALAAELNRYPGPLHALELADSLRLSADQTAAIQGVERAMRAVAIELGGVLIARERALDRLFADGGADSATVRGLALEIGRLQGELRSAHLEAHVAVTRLLTPDQRYRYQVARGYAAHGVGHAH
jgi:Spy/CpxP family protein refolding chaperone